MSDDRFDEWLREEAQEYNRPRDEAPREEMWAAIEQTRAARSPARVERGRLPGVGAWRLAAAAVLLLASGAAIGLWLAGSRSSDGGNAVAALSPDSVRAPAELSQTLAVATTEHLTAAEALLISFRGRAFDDSSTGESIRRWARDLLLTTRLLLDSPAGSITSQRTLLQDLEFVLAQIVQLEPDAPSFDRAMVDRTIAREQVLTRIRTSIPAGMAGGGAGGGGG